MATAASNAMQAPRRRQDQARRRLSALDVQGFELTGFNESWWLGLSVLHTLFAREHNLLCDQFAGLYPHLGRGAPLSRPRG